MQPSSLSSSSRKSSSILAVFLLLAAALTLAPSALARDTDSISTGIAKDALFSSLEQANERLHSGQQELRELVLASNDAHHSGPHSSAAAHHHSKDGASDSTTTDVRDMMTWAASGLDTRSACSADVGCPRAAMVWASGSFVFPQLLTPGSFAVDANLSLKLSLCCGYKFNGAMLRDEATYDTFLETLLRASPFQVLPAGEKRRMFPRERATIINSKTGKLYNSAYELTAKDIAEHNDGDGDVLVLFTGEIGAAALSRVQFTSLHRHGGAAITNTGNDPDTISAGGIVDNREEDVSADMQLRVVNLVLKCKCPHTLLVMPLLRVQPDRLGPVGILGVGSHCSVASVKVQRRRPHRFVVHVSNATAPGGISFATSFAVSPPVLPATRVTWTVREHVGSHTGHRALLPIVFAHSRIIPASMDATGALMLSDAASPFFTVVPNVRYEVQVVLSRGPWVDAVSAQGTFTLRTPFNRSWALPPLVPAPHFGFTRLLHLSDNHTLVHPEFGAALNPQQQPLLPIHEGKGRRPLNYHGYWENAPLDDQLLPQHAIRVAHNPYEKPAAPFPLFIGKNIIAYLVSDVDDVCDPVPLEGRELWAVQGIIRSPAPITTACSDTVDVEALVLRQLLHRIRTHASVSPRIAVNVPRTRWFLDFAEEGLEGQFGCRRRKVPARKSTRGKASTEGEDTMVAYEGTCDVHPTSAGGVSGTTAQLKVTRRGVYAVEWAARIVLDNATAAALLVSENIDPAYATVLGPVPAAPKGENSDDAATKAAMRETAVKGMVAVEVRSHLHLVVRRTARYPQRMTVTLPMHERRWVVFPPLPIVSPDSAPSNSAVVGVSANDEGNDAVAAGYWLARTPLRRLSVDENMKVELDTSQVPNVHRVLPNGTLQFIAQDPGEDLRVTYDIPYTSRCPDITVEVLVSVVAMKAPPVVPAYVPVYTEDECVRLEAPRPPRKDEVVQWHVPPCAAASRAPYLVESLQPLLAVRGDGDSPSESEGPAFNDTASAGQRRTVLMACGVEVYRRCDVAWTVTNLVGTVTKTFSLRRCQRPPGLLFHKDGLQQDHSVPYHRIFLLPLIAEMHDAAVALTYRRLDAAVLEGVEEVRVHSATAAGRRATHTQVPHFHRLRSVIPIAGYGSDVGYSFNFTGPQTYFEAEVRYRGNETANQLIRTRTHFAMPRPDQGRYAGGGAERENARQEEGLGKREAVPSLEWRRREFTQLIAQLHRQRQYNNDDGDGDYPAHYDEDAVARADIADLEAAAEDFWRSYEDREDISGDDVDLASASDVVASLSDHSGGGVTRAYVAQLLREARLRDRVEDERAGETFSLHHYMERRRLELRHLHNSSLYPIDVVVRPARVAMDAAAAEDGPEFAKRGMCLAHTSFSAILAINPRGAVYEDERFGTMFPPPAAPAVAVLPFCSSQFIFSRHPDLSSVYAYDFVWECAETEVIRVDMLSSVYSILTHVESPGVATVQDRNTAATTGDGPLAGHANQTNCRLTVRNHITETVSSEWFLLRRVYPSKLANTEFVVLSENAVPLPGEGAHSGSDEKHDTDGKEERRGGLPTERITSYQQQQQQQPTVRRVVGKSVVLHVDAPSDSFKATWQVLSVVPATQLATGSHTMKDSVRFRRLYQHPAALARGRGGATALVSGLNTPGLYTIAHHLPDPAYPAVCPNVTLVQTIDVVHAQVREKELVICGGTAALHAVPLPRDLTRDFIGQWEVVSLQTSADDVWTTGVNFTGVRFDSGNRPDTLVHGLPFGILTIRWAIYRRYHSSSSSSSSGGDDFTTQRRLVDYDTVRVLVLTENLMSQRLVTLSSSAEIVTTSSTVDWTVERDAVAAASPGASSSVKIAVQPLSNYTALYSEDSLLFPYLGTSPRPGMGLLTASRLPVGTVRLHYKLQPSVNVFGAMVGHACSLRNIFDIERVSAYLTATTTLDHECDAYTGKGKVSLCLHAEDPTPKRKKRGHTKDSHNSHMSSSSSSWDSTIRLASLDTLESTIKNGAMELHQRGGGCAVPWWVWPGTQWLDVSPISRAGMPESRCVSITVRAPRHLSPREATQSLFTTAMGLGSGTGGSDDVARTVGSTGGSSSSSLQCAGGSDFITSAVIEGTIMQMEEHTGSGDGLRRSRRGNSRDRVGIARYLPVLHFKTLKRVDVGLRPMIGLQGLPDEVSTELNVTHGEEAVVTLRLDMWQPKHLGGYPAYVKDLVASSSSEEEKKTPSFSLHPRSLLVRCAEGTVRAAEVLQFWIETNRPDGAVDKTAAEWLEYVYAVRDVRVPCEVLFVSLEHLTGDSKASSSSINEATKQQQQQQQKKGSATAASASSHEQRLVSLEVMEQQLDSIQRAHRVTKDGIDVTGLRGDLQDALSRRRITTSQLRAIEAARRSRQEREAEEERNRLWQLEKAPTTMSRAERLERALKAYRTASIGGGGGSGDSASGGEAMAIRIRLPAYEPFTVPYDLFLRTALHKDVICGTAVSPPAAVADSTAPRTPGAALVPNPYSLVTLSRVEIVDVAPVVTPFPPVIKQCEVEGSIPVLTINVTGTTFSAESFTADRILLEEIPNPNVPAHTSPLVGLKPCLPQLRNGMQAAVAVATRKHLFLQLSTCPTFQMLAAEEYNERQDSEELLARLQHPRFLRVTITNALAGDSYTVRGGAHNTHRPYNTTDVSFVITVQPTLARLHLHPYSRAARRSMSGGRAAFSSSPSTSSGFMATSARPLVLCEADLRLNGFELGVELIGDYWTPLVGEHGDDVLGKRQHQQHSADSDGSRVNEVEMLRRQEELQRLQEGGGFSPRPHTVIAPPGNSGSSSSGGTGDGAHEYMRYRAPQNVALINSFSVVEHHSLDSTHHLYLKGGGVYRSHFVNYLFSTVLADAHVLESHRFVALYNRTFVGIDVPPQFVSGVPSGDGSGKGQAYRDNRGEDNGDAEFYSSRADFEADESSDLLHGGQQQQRRYDEADGTSRDDGFRAWGSLPAVRRFSKIEEILFAVPGISTECRGCLLADTTFFMAGDLTGLWTYSSAVTAGSKSASSGNGFAAHMPPPLPSLENALLQGPLVVPWDSAVSIPRAWRLHWMCPNAARRALQRFTTYWAPPIIPRAGEAFMQVDIVAYTLRDVAGTELPVAQRPTTLLTSQPILLSSVLRRGVASGLRTAVSSSSSSTNAGAAEAAPLLFHFNESAVEAAYTTVAADLLRYRQQKSFTSFDYYRDVRYAKGLLAVNASVFVKLCIPVYGSAVDGSSSPSTSTKMKRGGAVVTQCMVVSITDSLMTVEAPPKPKSSLLRSIFSFAGSSTSSSGSDGEARHGQSLTFWAFIHQTVLSLLFFAILPILGIVDADPYGGAKPSFDDSVSSSFLEQMGEEGYRARVGLSVMFCVAVTFLYVYAPPVLWLAVWLSVWTVVLYCYKSLETVIAFVLSAVYWHYTRA